MFAAVACIALAACAGGGGGGSGAPASPVTPTPDPPTTPTTPTNPSLPLNPPPTSGAEFQRNYGLAAIHADAGYALGATGKGVTVAVIDTGFNTAAADMQGAYSTDSVDIVAARNALAGVDRHGADVAGVLAARFNGLGTVGAAYESTVLGIRADNTAASSCPASCIFNTDDLARAIDYAVAKGAKVVNMSLGAVDTDAARSATLEAALTRAVAAGLVFTSAAGNAGDANPAAYTLYAVDSRYAGAFLSVGASDATTGMAVFSNRAGTGREGYIVAPGAAIATNCDADSNCYLASGTSFATPQVSGALAMLLQYFPGLSGRDAIAILLRTADDRGDAGTDAVWGRGAMNLTKAFEPVGSTTLSLSDGQSVDLAAPALSASLGAAFGDALESSTTLTTFVSDDYNRLFAIDLAQDYGAARRSALGALTLDPSLDTAEALDLPAGGRLTLAAQAPMFPTEAEVSPATGLLRPDDAASAGAGVRIGAFDFTAWRGQGAVVAPEGPGGRNAFTSVAAADRVVSGAVRMGRFAFGGEGGWADRRAPMSIVASEASAYGAASLAYAGPSLAVSVTGGTLNEPRGALGSQISASPLSLAARTRFAALRIDRSFAGLSLRAEASMGRTDGGGGLLSLDRAISSSWRLALGGACAPALPCRGFGIELAQPLRIERGDFRALLADLPAAPDAPLSFSERRVAAAPSAREIDLRLNTEQPLGGGALRLQAAAAFNPAHQTSAADIAISAAWRTKF